MNWDFHITFFAVQLVIVYGITTSSIFSVPRVWVRIKTQDRIGGVLYCPICVGFWVGLGLAFTHTVAKITAGTFTWGAMWWLYGVSLKGTAALILLSGYGVLPDTLYDYETKLIEYVEGS